MEHKILNVAVIGGSTMGRLHMQGVVNKESAHLYAICDVDPQVLKTCRERFPEVTMAVTDWRELVNVAEIDAVVVCVPDRFHPAMSEAFLRAGKHVLCEKPMALTLAECEQMRLAEKESGKMLMIGQVCRCTPAFIMAKNLIDGGRIGELFFLESEYAHDYSVARGANDWRVDPDRHGVIGGGCHAIDLLRWIAGDPTEVFAYANHKCLTDWPVDDCTIAIFQFPNNVTGKVLTSIGCKRDYTMRSVFYGTKGTIICDNTSPTLTLMEVGDGERINGKRPYTVPKPLSVEVNNHNIDLEISVFIDALQGKTAMPVSSLEGAKTVAVCCATVEAAKNHAITKITYPQP